MGKRMLLIYIITVVRSRGHSIDEGSFINGIINFKQLGEKLQFYGVFRTISS